MSKFKNEKGLTLIELLITISVLAVVSAIALPVINNVVTSSNSNALTQTIKDADDFIAKYSKSGVVLYDGLRTLSGYVDADGDNVIDASEKIDTLTLADKYAMSATGSASVGGSYTAGGVASVSITGATSTGGATPSPSAPAYPGVEFSPGDFDTALKFYGNAGGSALGYVSFNPATTSTALQNEITSGGSTWTINIVNAGQTLTYTGTRGSSTYFSPDWSTIYSATPNPETVVPNFTYSITKVYVQAVTNTLTVIVQ